MRNLTAQTIHSDDAPGSRIDANVQQVPSATRFPQNDPVSTTSISVAHPSNSTEPCDMNRFLSIEFTAGAATSLIAIAINGGALRQSQ